MKSTEEDGIKVLEGNIMEEKSQLLPGGKWSLAKKGALKVALEAFLPFRNIPYKAQLAARSKELDQTLDDITKHSEDAFAKDTKYAKKPSIKKPPLEDIIPMIPNVGYERSVTLGLEKDKGKVRTGIRVLYEKNGENYRFLLPLSECSNVAPQIIKAAEATVEFLTQQKFAVSDGVKNCQDILGLKFAMNEIGEIIMSLVLVIDHEAPPKAESDSADGEKVENMVFYMPGAFKKQLREFFFKTNVTSQIKEDIEKYTPALKKFVEDNRARLGVVGVYLTWYDAASSPELKPAVPPWYHVAGDESLTETVNSVRLELLPHLENIHPSRPQAITAVVNTIVDGLSLQNQSALILLLSEFYYVANLLSQKFKKTAVLEDLQKPLQSYLKEKSKHNIRFVSSRDSRRLLLHDHTPEAVILWGHLKDDEPFISIISQSPRKRPRKIAWVVDRCEDSTDPGGNKCSNANLLERNHKKLYPYYTLDRVVGIDVGPQKGGQLTLVAFYKNYDGVLRLNDGQTSQSKDNKEGAPKAESKVSNQQVPGGLDTKRKAPDQHGPGSLDAKKKTPNQRGPGGPSAEKRDGVKKGSNSKGRRNDPEEPIGAKRPRRGGSPQPGRRGPSRHMSYLRTREPMGPGERQQNPWVNNNNFDRPMAIPNQTASGVMSQLTNVIGKQLLLAQMNSALQLASSSNAMDDMIVNRAAGDHGGHDGPPRGNYDFPPPPRQLPSLPARSRARDVSYQGAPEDQRSAAAEHITQENYRSTSREDFARDNYRSAVREDNAQESFSSTSREDFIRNNYRSAARQEFTSDDFWNTPLEDLARNQFRSASPSREKIRSPSTSREAVLSMSTSRDDFPREDCKNYSREGLTHSNFFKSADQQEFRGARPTWGHGAVRSMSPDSEDYTTRNFRRTTRDGFVHGDFGSDIIHENLRTTRESPNIDYTSRAGQEDSIGENLIESSTRDYTSRAAPKDIISETFRRPTRESPDRDYTRSDFRSPAQENSRGTVRRNFNYDDRSSTKEDVTHDNDSRRAARADSTRSDFRRAPWEEARSGSGEDFYKDSGCTVRRDLTFDNYGGTRREGITHHSDSRYAARDNSAHSDLRQGPWEDARRASREDYSHEDTRRAERDDFNGAGKDNFKSAAGEDFLRVALRDTPQEKLARDDFFGSRKSFGSGRDSFVSSSRNSVGDGNFRSGNAGYHNSSRDTNYASSGRFGRDQDTWAGDITRRKY